MPHELIAIRKALLSADRYEGLRLYTMILFHCQLFLRSAEGCPFRIEDILTSLVSVNPDNGDVNCMGVKIKGKADGSFVPLMIWRCTDVPELCLVSHLLLWLSVSGITSGYLFPKKKGSSDCFDFTTFNNQLKKLLSDVVGRDDGRVWGTHTLRKTGYLLAIWGKGELGQIMLSARHKTVESAKRYYGSAAAFLKMISLQKRSALLTVDYTWEAIHMSDHRELVALNENPIGGLPDLFRHVRIFVENLVAQRVLAPNKTRNIIALSQAILQARDQSIDAKIDNILALMQAKGFGDLTGQLVELLARKYALQGVQDRHAPDSADNNADQRRSARGRNRARPAVSSDKDSSGDAPANNNDAFNADAERGLHQSQPRAHVPIADNGRQAGGISDEQPRNDLEPEPRSGKRRRREAGDFDVADRDMSNIDTHAKLRTMRRIEIQCAGRAKNSFTPSMRTFYYNVLTPVLNCLRRHCNDDDDEFARRWGDQFAHTDFKKRRCPGSHPSNGCGWQG
ncbi:Tyr recombinase domain-containing protein [Plasmodiophora brassicae]